MEHQFPVAGNGLREERGRDEVTDGEMEGRRGGRKEGSKTEKVTSVSDVSGGKREREGERERER